jgi:hypothetical protein
LEGLTKGLLEGINSLIQAAKAKARGYRNTQNIITMADLVAGNCGSMAWPLSGVPRWDPLPRHPPEIARNLQLRAFGPIGVTCCLGSNGKIKTPQTLEK